ncbi:MAG: ComEC/Rec2 family competence protein [Alphaproteobacteria bacterium]|nr:ComEC/Rec2 family competence protein [Alphaproteobacteria bacterium]
MYHILQFLSSFQFRRWQQNLILRFEKEDSRWFLWLPVGVGLGIVIYFTLRQEPPFWLGSGSLILLAGLIIFSKHSFCLMSLNIMLLTIALGFTCAQWRSYGLGKGMISTSLGQREFKGEIEGIELRPEGQRVTFNNIQYKLKIDPAPRKIRIIMRGKLQPLFALQMGQTLSLKAVLLPPSEPVAPGAYNFRQRAFFEGVDAVGFATTQPILIKNVSQKGPIAKFSIKWARMRHGLTQRLRQGIGGKEGEIAAALITGDRSGITRELQQSFADSGIAHILAISGLHLSIISGLAFLMFRRILSLVPWIALNYPIKKWSAALAILLTSGYLGLCGGSIPALRAFLMTTIMLLAIILDRTALSMRNVAIAALMILILWPESLLGPSFQLSFAAVIALIATYEGGQMWLLNGVGKKTALKRIRLYVSGIMLTTLIASLATTPFSIYVFHRFSLHAIGTNLVAIPLTTLWIMPLAILSIGLMPFNCEGLALKFLGQGIHWLITIADQVSKWPGAVILVPIMHPGAMPLLVGGGLWLCLWKQRWRWWGLGPITAGLVLLISPNPPDIYISGDGKLVGVRGENGSLWLTSIHSKSFIRETWLAQQGLNQFQPLTLQKEGYRFYFPKVQKTLLIRTDYKQTIICKDSIVNLKQVNPDLACINSLEIHPADLQQQGAHAIWLRLGETPFVHTVAKDVGIRPWSLKR